MQQEAARSAAKLLSIVTRTVSFPERSGAASPAVEQYKVPSASDVFTVPEVRPENKEGNSSKDSMEATVTVE